MEDEGEKSPAYNRQETIDEILHMVWFIHLMPLFIGLFFLSSIGLALSFPISFGVWLIVGDRPIHRMPPANFFFLMFWGVYWRARPGSELWITRMIYQLSYDYQLICDHPYRDVFRSIRRGGIHPVTGFEYTIPARILTLAYFVISFVPFIQLASVLFS